MDPNAVPRKETQIITWGPVAAVVGTLVIYFSAQFMAEIIFALYALARGWGLDEANSLLQNSILVQFGFIVAVEVLTLGMLYRFLQGRKANFRTLGLRKPRLNDIGYALMGFGLYLPLLIIITQALEVLLPQIDQEQQQQLGFEAVTTQWQLALVFISLVILPPLVEEILVRGYLYLGLKSRLPRFWAVIIASFIFGLAHLQLGTGAPPLWAAAVDTFVLSLILIYLRDITNGLWAPIGLHAIKNGIAFWVLFIAPDFIG